MNLWGSINCRYGSKRGLLKYQQAFMAHALGRYERYKNIDFGAVERLVFVCAGNICRSPLAERVARDAGCEACSFGLECSSDRPADSRIALLAQLHGYSLQSHRTRQADALALSPSDLLVAMELRHLSTLEQRGLLVAQSTLLGLWHDRPRPYIHDPYNADEAYREQCTLFLIEATQRLAIQCHHAHPEWRTSTRSG